MPNASQNNLYFNHRHFINVPGMALGGAFHDTYIDQTLTPYIPYFSRAIVLCSLFSSTDVVVLVDNNRSCFPQRHAFDQEETSDL